MSILTAAPYNLVQGDSVYVKVYAINTVGQSPESDINTIAALV
jgi:hypothetical protein